MPAGAGTAGVPRRALQSRTAPWRQQRVALGSVRRRGFHPAQPVRDQQPEDLVLLRHAEKVARVVEYRNRGSRVPFDQLELVPVSHQHILPSAYDKRWMGERSLLRIERELGTGNRPEKGLVGMLRGRDNEFLDRGDALGPLNDQEPSILLLVLAAQTGCGGRVFVQDRPRRRMPRLPRILRRDPEHQPQHLLGETMRKGARDVPPVGLTSEGEPLPREECFKKVPDSIGHVVVRVDPVRPRARTVARKVQVDSPPSIEAGKDRLETRLDAAEIQGKSVENYEGPTATVRSVVYRNRRRRGPHNS